MARLYMNRNTSCPRVLLPSFSALGPQCIIGTQLYNVASKVPAAYQTPLNLVGSLNTTRLAIEQRATDLAHYEIVPVLAECNGTTQMTQATYETLLKGVTLTAQ